MRIIPASAGNTRSPERCGPSRADHPRERGEHIGAGLRKAGRRGSSPRARGTRVMTPKVGRCGRIIPASAGNTCRKASGMAPHPDHPRERGEHDTRRVSTVSRTDHPRERGNTYPIIQNGAGFRSSPRARGTRHCQKLWTSSLRIIRERGEHPGHVLPPDASAGSSPRARGTRDQLAQNRLTDGSSRERGDHTGAALTASNPGSSPRARGTREQP